MRKIKGYEDWTAPLISRSVRSTLSLDSKLWKASLRFFQSIRIRQMNCSRIEISFYKNIPIDISSMDIISQIYFHANVAEFRESSEIK